MEQVNHMRRYRVLDPISGLPGAVNLYRLPSVISAMRFGYLP